MSDALKIARWCWPNEPWQDSANMRLATGGITGTPFYPDRRDDIAAAERVVIERGLGASYAAALLDQLDIGIHAWCCDHADAIRAAPLDAIVRALVAAIDAQEERQSCAK